MTLFKNIFLEYLLVKFVHVLVLKNQEILFSSEKSSTQEEKAQMYQKEEEKKGIVRVITLHA